MGYDCSVKYWLAPLSEVSNESFEHGTSPKVVIQLLYAIGFHIMFHHSWYWSHPSTGSAMLSWAMNHSPGTCFLMAGNHIKFIFHWAAIGCIPAFGYHLHTCRWRPSCLLLSLCKPNSWSVWPQCTWAKSQMPGCTVCLMNRSWLGPVSCDTRLACTGHHNVVLAKDISCDHIPGHNCKALVLMSSMAQHSSCHQERNKYCMISSIEFLGSLLMLMLFLQPSLRIIASADRYSSFASYLREKGVSQPLPGI